MPPTQFQGFHRRPYSTTPADVDAFNSPLVTNIPIPVDNHPPVVHILADEYMNHESTAITGTNACVAAKGSQLC